MRSGYRSNENGQNAKSSIQNLSQICDEILAEQNQNVVEIASERISVETERERKDTKEELKGQDVREQDEGATASANGTCERQGSESESEEEPQVQNHNRATTSELSRYSSFLAASILEISFWSFFGAFFDWEIRTVVASCAGELL